MIKIQVKLFLSQQNLIVIDYKQTSRSLYIIVIDKIIEIDIDTIIDIIVIDKIIEIISHVPLRPESTRNVRRVG